MQGRIQFDWTFAVAGNFEMNLQLADGYGQTLIDTTTDRQRLTWVRHY
ncbi:phospholipase A [Agriterribacter humi]